MNATMSDHAAWLAKKLEKAAKSGIYGEEVEITPSLAEFFMSRNAGNRPFFPSTAAKYLRDIKQGGWEVNGQPIIFADDGLMNDGQHRSSAIIDSGETVKSLVVFGVSRSSRLTVDTNRVRTAQNVLGMSGVPNSVLLATAVRICMNLEQGTPTATQYQPHECLEWLDSHPGVQDVVHVGASVAKAIGGTATMWIALAYMMRQRDETLQQMFFDGLISGLDLNERDPVYLLRKRVIENAAHSKNKMPARELTALAVKAINATLRGEHIKTLRYSPHKGEPFPKLDDKTQAP